MTKVVNKYHEDFDIWIGRGSIHGNQFIIGIHGNREDVIGWHRIWFEASLADPIFRARVEMLRGQRLG